RLAVINRAMAERDFPDGKPIGKQFRLRGSAPEAPFATVIGVVENTRDNAVSEEPSPEVYYSYLQVGSDSLSTALMIRTAGPSKEIMKSIRRKIQELDPAQPLPEAVPMETIMKRSMSLERFVTWIVAMLGSIALILSTAGIYGVVSNRVGLRTREIGIRVA